MDKILYVCPSGGRGEAETFLRQTFSQGNKQAFQNHYLLFEAGPLAQDLMQMGAQVTLLNCPPRFSSRNDRAKVAETLRNIINQKSIKLVHSSSSLAALFSAWTCRQMQVRHVWFQHASQLGWQDRVAGLLPHDGLMVNSHYTAQSQRAVENPLRFLIPRKIPIEKILLGTEISSPHPDLVAKNRAELLARFGLSQETFCFAMLTRLEERKGVSLFLEALKILKSQEPNLPVFGFVWGEAQDPEYYSRLKTHIERDALPAGLLGASNNPALDLASSQAIVDGCVYPEGFSLVVVEGMMVGATPLIPDQGGCVEVVSHGHTGLHYPMSDARALSQQMALLAKDWNLNQKLSEAARLDAASKYTAERAIHQMEAFHRRVLSD